ncbi:MAG: ClpXP protease specificity-enhancing factor SspB [Cognatishimia sp.]|nr:ClpXP protease specificity-enhancing factor SspB [Cognatishimia sp.]
MSQTIEYGNLMHRALRRLIQEVLEDVRDNGLPGEHHFFITFDTRHPGANIADWLMDRYPSDMTVVMQHWFDNLEITDDGFSVTLNFGDAPEPLYIPFEAIKTFVDPSVEFGLRFESQSDEDDLDEDEESASADVEEIDIPPAEPHAETETDTETADADVVSLDSFRKK